MLDKSVPYYNIIMRRRAETPVLTARLPAGYSFVSYKPGDELAWAEIVASVGEFDSTEEARIYFQKKYMSFPKELERRTIFIETDSGEKISTLTIWWDFAGSIRIPSVEWVATRPEYQGLGLGKAIVFQGMKNCLAIEGDIDVYLHTQTWSYQAVGIYLQAGFSLLESGTFSTYQNDYQQALPILRDKMKKHDSGDVPSCRI